MVKLLFPGLGSLFPLREYFLYITKICWDISRALLESSPNLPFTLRAEKIPVLEMEKTSVRYAIDINNNDSKGESELDVSPAQNFYVQEKAPICTKIKNM